MLSRIKKGIFHILQLSSLCYASTYKKIGVRGNMDKNNHIYIVVYLGNGGANPELSIY